MESAANNIILQLGFAGIVLVVLGMFARTVINRMFAREDEAIAERKTLIQNNTAVMSACTTELGHLRQAIVSNLCPYSGERPLRNENRPPPDSRQRSGPQPLPAIQHDSGA